MSPRKNNIITAKRNDITTALSKLGYNEYKPNFNE